MSTLSCPTCHNKFAASDSDALPFCSRRCRQIDLNRWLGEEQGLPIEDPSEADQAQADQAELDRQSGDSSDEGSQARNDRWS